MKARLQAWLPQPLTAIALTLVAALSLGWLLASAAASVTRPGDSETWLLTAFLVAVLVWAGIHPIHIRHRFKVYLTTPSFYLMAVLLPTPVAAVAAAIGIWLIQWLMRAKTGNLPSDMATAAARWLIVILVCGGLAHLPASDDLSRIALLFATAGVMFLGDMLTCPFEIAPMSGEPYWMVATAFAREGGAVEAIQYVLGIVGALLAIEHSWMVGLLVPLCWVVYRAFKNAKEMQDSTRTLLEGMADAVDLRDPYTGGHSRRVTEYCAQILRELRVTGCEADLILGAARVHDIGKIGVPDGILNKPSRLTPEEQAIMQSHSEMGAQLLARYPDFARGQDIVRHHHERWDGKGYPAGLKQMNIPFGARVIAVADSFDAMISDRPYRKGVSVQGACAILREERGRQWDPQVVDACLRALEQPLVEPASTASTDALRRAPVNAPASTFA